MTHRARLLTATALALLPMASFADDLSFAPVAAPTDDATKRQVVATASVSIGGMTAPLAYHVMARSGDMIGGRMFAGLVDKDGKVLEGVAPSNAADFTSFLPVGDKLFSITHFEENPAVMYLSELAQDADGILTPLSTRPIDFSAVGGFWRSEEHTSELQSL